MSKVTDQLQDIARRVGEGREAESEAILDVCPGTARCLRAVFPQRGEPRPCAKRTSTAVCAELRAIIKALVLLKEWSKRSNDAILSFGERLSTIILVHRAHERGMEAELLRFPRADQNGRQFHRRRSYRGSHAAAR